MAIPVGFGFKITNNDPADVKSYWATTASLYSSSLIPPYVGGYISSSWRYIGMTVFCRDDSAEYRLIGGISDENWIKISSGSVYASASYAITASYALNGGGSGSGVVDGGSYNISASWASQSLSSSYASNIDNIYINIDGGDAFSNFGGVFLSPLNCGGA